MTGNTLADALSLPKGRWYSTVFGVETEESVEERYLEHAVNALNEADFAIEANTQAEIIVKAENAGVGFQRWISHDFGLIKR
jgi:hypothetical protein